MTTNQDQAARMDACELEMARLKREVSDLRVFIRETIAHYDLLLPERIAVANRITKRHG